jgi:hypothetical protein
LPFLNVSFAVAAANSHPVMGNRLACVGLTPKIAERGASSEMWITSRGFEGGALPEVRELHVPGDGAVLVGEREHGRRVQGVQGDRLVGQPHHLDERVTEHQQVGDDAA